MKSTVVTMEDHTLVAAQDALETELLKQLDKPGRKKLAVVLEMERELTLREIYK